MRNEYDLMPGSWLASYKSEQSETRLSDILMMRRRALSLGNHLCIHALETRGFCFVRLDRGAFKNIEKEMGIIRNA